MVFEEFISSHPDLDPDALGKALASFSKDITELSESNATLFGALYLAAQVRAIETVLKEIVTSWPEFQKRLERLSVEELHSLSSPPSLSSVLDQLLLQGLLSRLTKNET